MGVPFGRFLIEIALQRRQDALECLHLAVLTPEEAARIHSGLLKQDALFLFNRACFPLLVGTLYRGRLLEGARHVHLSVPRLVLASLVCLNYLDCGDYLAADLLWNDTKYIYYKYEPLIRRLRRERHPNFLLDPALA